VWADLGDGVPDGICVDADKTRRSARVANPLTGLTVIPGHLASLSTK
jgi:hypothetical protein